jgi:hypothetical protein
MWGVSDALGKQTDKMTQASSTAEPYAAMFYCCDPVNQHLRNIHRQKVKLIS